MTNRNQKITVKLPSELIARAMKATGLPLTPLLERGLTLAAQEKQFDDLRALRGKLKFSLDFDRLRDDA